jgi:hypothetical protein
MGDLNINRLVLHQEPNSAVTICKKLIQRNHTSQDTQFSGVEDVQLGIYNGFGKCVNVNVVAAPMVDFTFNDNVCSRCIYFI